ncbi:MAG TPA: hypothetical protein VK789_28210 [Bryobacteraceae bacterium]|jgi:hypothetical protein|nr:hypothetical protein [Bryobacteraceae bacterium]
MTIAQAFFAMATLMVTLFGLAIAFFKYYIDAKIDGKIDPLTGKVDSLARNVERFIDYMILHEGKIATLEERTKHL